LINSKKKKKKNLYFLIFIKNIKYISLTTDLGLIKIINYYRNNVYKKGYTRRIIEYFNWKVYLYYFLSYFFFIMRNE